MDTKTEVLLSTQVAVLGCILIDASVCGEIFSRVTASDFPTAEYRHVFEAAQRLFVAGKPVDSVMICAECGGNEYRDMLMQIMEITPSASAWREYTDKLREQSTLWHVKKIAERIQLAATADEARELLGQAEAATTQRQNTRIVDMAHGMVNFITEQGTPRQYLEYGIDRIDRMLYTAPGDFIVLGGYPSAGKTALAITMADHISRTKRVGFFSLETSENKIYDRFFSQACLLDFGKIKRRALSTEDFETLTQRKQQLATRKLEVVQAAGMSAADIGAIALSQRYEVIFVDYLQLIRGSGYNRTEEVSKISMAMHTFAQQNNVTVIALAQLSRAEKDKGAQKAPTLSSLRESGQIEQDADAVMLLYPADPENPKGDRRLKIAKNKEGEIGAFDLNFDGKHQMFVQYADERQFYAKSKLITPTPVLCRDPEPKKQPPQDPQQRLPS